MTTVRHHLAQALIWAALCLMAQQASGKDYFSKEMEKRQNHLSTYFKTTNGDLGALFGKLLENLDKTLPKPIQLLQASETVKVYIDILTNLRAEMQDETAKNDTEYLRSKMEELRTHYFSDQVKQMNILSQHLKQLEAIKIDDEVVQRKAIFELKYVYNRVSLLGDTANSQSQSNPTLRRRRQTRRPIKSKP